MSIETPAAQIHDLGYKRYLGTRRPQRTRFWIIARTAARMSWRGFWRSKVWVLLGAVAVVVMGAIMQVTQSEIVEGLVSGGVAVTWADAMVPMSFTFLWWVVIWSTIINGAGVVASDVKMGAFEVYFSRPVRPVDYTLGKVLGAVMITAPILLFAPVALSIWRVAIAGDTSGILHALPICGQTVVAGILYTVVFSVVPIGVSALASRPLYSILIWVGYEFFGGGILSLIAMVAHVPALGALNLQNALATITRRIFGQTMSLGHTGNADFQPVPPPLWAAIAGVMLFVGAALFLVIWRVRRAQKSGLGGG